MAWTAVVFIAARYLFVLIIASDLEGAWLREDILGRVVGVRVSDVVVIEVSFF
ncbi:hypothetical protein B398_08100 [Xylella fastidiosa 32]|nr:hypothetical protein B398_08100 [Xylella fastidiosa 32]